MIRGRKVNGDRLGPSCPCGCHFIALRIASCPNGPGAEGQQAMIGVYPDAGCIAILRQYHSMRWLSIVFVCDALRAGRESLGSSGTVLDVES